MEIKIPKEVRQHSESIFFGLSVRQLICSALAVAVAASIYFALRNVLGRETASWACIVAAAPVAVAGFFRYNGLTFAQSGWAFRKSRSLCAAPSARGAELIYCMALSGKGV